MLLSIIIIYLQAPIVKRCEVATNMAIHLDYDVLCNMPVVMITKLFFEHEYMPGPLNEFFLIHL